MDKIGGEITMFHHGQACCFCHGDHELMVLLGSFDGLPQCSPVNNLLRRFSYLFKHNSFLINFIYLEELQVLHWILPHILLGILAYLGYIWSNELGTGTVLEYRYEVLQVDYQ